MTIPREGKYHWQFDGLSLRVEGQLLYWYCCNLAPTDESFGVWRHDGNHDGRCKAIRICATESGKGDQEACYGNEKGGKREEGEGEGET